MINFFEEDYNINKEYIYLKKLVEEVFKGLIINQLIYFFLKFFIRNL